MNYIFLSGEFLKLWKQTTIPIPKPNKYHINPQNYKLMSLTNFEDH